MVIKNFAHWLGCSTTAYLLLLSCSSSHHGHGRPFGKCWVKWSRAVSCITHDNVSQLLLLNIFLKAKCPTNPSELSEALRKQSFLNITVALSFLKRFYHLFQTRPRKSLVDEDRANRLLLAYTGSDPQLTTKLFALANGKNCFVGWCGCGGWGLNFNKMVVECDVLGSFSDSLEDSLPLQSSFPSAGAFGNDHACTSFAKKLCNRKGESFPLKIHSTEIVA